MKIISYKKGSQSARLLCKVFHLKQRTREYKPIGNELLLNWGCSELQGNNCINNPDAVRIAGNKLLSFSKFSEHGVKTPEWTTDKSKVLDWNYVVCRMSLTGNSGHGIVIVEKGQPIPDAKLYTKYVTKTHEWRVHVFDGKVIRYQMKKRVRGFNADNMVRSYDNGWVFCTENIELPDVVKEEAIKAVDALDLDFGAVDVGSNKENTKVWIFEVNTAPGIAGATIEAYVKAIKERLV